MPWVQVTERFAWHVPERPGVTIWFNPGLQFVKRCIAEQAIEAGKAKPARRSRKSDDGQEG